MVWKVEQSLQHPATVTPSPTLPARGRVFIEAVALSSPHTRNGTSPLAGEVGRGVRSSRVSRLRL
jgi:hypothetical protein